MLHLLLKVSKIIRSVKKRNQNMRKITTISIIALIALLLCASCKNEPDVPSEESLKVKKSILTMSFAGKSFSTEDGIFHYSYNIDENEAPSDNFVFEAYHYRADGSKSEDKFTFNCEELELYHVENNSCSFNAANLKQIGSYTVTAKSSVSEAFDTYFIINVISNKVSLAIEYTLDPAYQKKALSEYYTEEVLSGSITKYTKELTLCAGAIYNFTVTDNSEKGHEIKNLTLDSSRSIVYFRESTGNEGSFVCLLADNDYSSLRFTVGKTDISVSVRVNLKDITQAQVKEIDPASLLTETILSFTKNPEAERDKAFVYQVKMETVAPEEAELMFCVDYEDWSNDVERAYLANSRYQIPKRENPQWYTRTSLFRTFDDRQLFQVIIDGATRQFSIVPLNDTVWRNTTDNLDYNRHCYIYAKYKNDPNDVCRFKWRIMIGGVLEGIQLIDYSISNDTETILPHEIEIREGDSTSRVFRAKYIPTTIADTTTVWYLAKSDIPILYTNASTGDTFKALEPIDRTNGFAMSKALNILSSVDGGTDGYTVISGYQNSAGKFFKVINYYMRTAEDGVCDIWTTFNSIGQDVILVAFNVETRMYNYVKIKDVGDKQITIRGITSLGREIPKNII